LRAKEQEEKEARLAKLRPALRNMLKGNPNVYHYTTFRTADKLFAQHPIWQQARLEAERKLIFEEYVTELKQREMVCHIFCFRKLTFFMRLFTARVSCFTHA
jgi:pre-mRNA-processing factor 40